MMKIRILFACFAGFIAGYLVHKFNLAHRMKRVFEHAYNSKIIFIVIIFICSVTVRGYIVYKTPGMNDNIDLCIYVNMGRLVSHGVNPYDFNDNVELRSTFRNDGIAYSEWVSETQERWDYYASSNLPLTGLYLGLIDRFFPNNALAYRLSFMFVDIILCILIGLFIREFWKKETSIYISWFFVLGLGAFNPILLKWGIMIPEEKNLQIVFMLSSLYFALKTRLFLSSVLLGCSVAFKGLGVFIGPILLFIWLEKTKGYPHRYMRIFSLCVISLIFCFIWFVPYYPEVFTMMYRRFSGGGSSVIHGSLWTLIYPIIGDYWKIVRIITICIMISVSFISAVKGKLKYQTFFLGVFYSFTVLWLSGGSMDRYNIAVLYIVLSMGLIQSINYKLLAGVYIFLYGAFYVNGIGFSETYDALFLLLFTIDYIAELLRFCSSKTAIQQC